MRSDFGRVALVWIFRAIIMNRQLNPARRRKTQRAGSYRRAGSLTLPKCPRGVSDLARRFNSKKTASSRALRIQDMRARQGGFRFFNLLRNERSAGFRMTGLGVMRICTRFRREITELIPARRKGKRSSKLEATGKKKIRDSGYFICEDWMNFRNDIIGMAHTSNVI